MAVPSVSGITNLWNYLDGDWVSAAVAGANAGMPVAELKGNPAGIDGSNDVLKCENGSTSTTSGQRYSAYYTFATASNGVDISGANQFIVFHTSSQTGFSRLSSDPDAVRFIAFSGGGTTDWAYWDMGGEGDPIYAGDAAWRLVTLGLTAPTATGGSYDSTDVTGIGSMHKMGSTGTFNFSHSYDQILHVDSKVTVTGGELANPAGLDELYDLLKATTTSDIRSMLFRRSGIGYESYLALDIQTDLWTSGTRALAFVEKDDIEQTFPAGFYSLDLVPKNSGTLDIVTSLFATASAAKYTINIDETAGTVELNTSSIEDASDIVIDGAGLGGSTIVGNTSPIEIQDVARGSWLVTASTSGGIDITGAAGDYSAMQCTLDDNITGNEVALGSGGAGAYDLTGIRGNASINIHNSSATNVITVSLASGVSATSSTAGGSITLITPPESVTINSTESGSLIVIYAAGTSTILASTTGTQLVYNHASETVDYFVGKAGFLLTRVTGLALSGTSVIDVVPPTDFVYDASHGLTYTTDASWASNQLTVPTYGPTVRQVHSLMIDSFISETALRNVAYNVQMNGFNTMIFIDDAEGASDANIQNMTDGGVRYLDTGGAVTAEWFGVQSTSSVTPAGTGEFQQQDGTGTTDARASGDFDEIIKMYGDVSHGSFDYRDHAVFKFQLNGYGEVRVDVLESYGISVLEPILYIIAMQPLALSAAAGDPAISITIVDHTGSPLVVGGKSFDYEVQDNGTNSGEDILRELDYNLSLDATYQGKDPFNWFDMLVESAGAQETVRGPVEGIAGLHGVYVSRSAADHPDIIQHQSNDGTYYVPPTVAGISAANLTAGTVQLYNVTTDSLIETVTITSGYTKTWTDGTDATSGDILRLRWIHKASDPVEATAIATADTTVGVLNSPSTDGVYAAYAIDGATVLEYSSDFPNVQVDINDPDNVFYIDRLYAWYKAELMTTQGIDKFWGAISAPNTSSVIIHNDIVDIFLDNTKATSARQGDTIVLQRDDGVFPQVTVTSGGGGLGFYYTGIGYSASSGSGLDSTERAKLLGLNDFNPSTHIVENGKTYDNHFRLMKAEAAGKAAVSGSTVTFRDDADTKDRITATTDANGQRTVVTTDGT